MRLWSPGSGLAGDLPSRSVDDASPSLEGAWPAPSLDGECPTPCLDGECPSPCLEGDLLGDGVRGLFLVLGGIGGGITDPLPLDVCVLVQF